MIEWWQYGFLQRAVAAGTLMAIASGLLGVVLLLRRCSLMGEGLGHFALGAVGLALLLTVPPLAVALPLAVVAALLIFRLADRGTMFGDAAIGMAAAVGMSAGVALAGLGGGFRVDLFSYLFGDILAITPVEVALAAGVALTVGMAMIGWRRVWLALAFDADHARTTGVRVARFDRALAVLTALTVVLGLRLVGGLLVSSLLIFPAATALLIVESFIGAMAVAVAVAVAAVLGGLAAACAINVPAGPAIVLLQALLFAVTWVATRFHR